MKPHPQHPPRLEYLLVVMYVIHQVDAENVMSIVIRGMLYNIIEYVIYNFVNSICLHHEYLMIMSPVTVTLDISGSPIETHSGSRKYIDKLYRYNERWVTDQELHTLLVDYRTILQIFVASNICKKKLYWSDIENFKIVHLSIVELLYQINGKLFHMFVIQRSIPIVTPTQSAVKYLKRSIY